MFCLKPCKNHLNQKESLKETYKDHVNEKKGDCKKSLKAMFLQMQN